MIKDILMFAFMPFIRHYKLYKERQAALQRMMDRFLDE